MTSKASGVFPGRHLSLGFSNSFDFSSPFFTRASRSCFMEIHPTDAKKLEIANGDMVRITSRRGECEIRARVVSMPRPGMVFVPWHWDDDKSLINRVTIDAYDPGSKQPEFKICAVQLAKA